MKKINITGKVLKTIKNKNIKPIPKIFFILKKVFIYFLFLLTLIISGLSISIIFSYLKEVDVSLIYNLGVSDSILAFIPLFWVILISGILFPLIYLFKKIKRGYKFETVSIINIIIIFSLILGFVFFKINISQKLDNTISNYISKENSFIHINKKDMILRMWNNPEKGLLIGKIKYINLGYLRIEDQFGKNWFIRVSNNTLIRSDTRIEKGYNIKIKGKLIDTRNFKAEKILPFLINKYK